MTWAAACALYILWLGCPPPGASRDATPRLGRAVVTDQWEVDKAEYGRHRRSADNDFRQTAPATGSSPDNKPDTVSVSISVLCSFRITMGLGVWELRGVRYYELLQVWTKPPNWEYVHRGGRTDHSK